MRLYLLAAIATFFLSVAAGAQTYPDQSRISEPGPPTIVLGETCTRVSDGQEGIAKMDACFRPYCGKREELDIADINPDFARDMQCQWTIAEDETCRCKPNDIR